MAKAKRRQPDEGEGAKGSGKRPRLRLPRFRIAPAWIFSTIMSTIVWMGLVAGIVVAIFSMDLPESDEAALTRRPNIRLMESGGWEVANFGDIYGQSIDLKALPPHVPAAVISVEDRRFYSHPGIDPRGILRAVVTDISVGARVQGGSTITQQVAKNLFLTPDRTLARKIREALLAIKLEQMFT